MLIITSLVTSILALLYVKLTFNVIGHRRRNKVSLGDGGNDPLNRAIRAHGNFIEYTPIAILLIACLEYNQAPYWMIVPLAFLLTAGRIIHPIGMNDSSISWSPRVQGMKLTLVSIIGLALSNIVWLLMQLT